MLTAFRNWRISIKTLVPLALIALIALGTGGYVGRALVVTDSLYTHLLDHESKAAIHSVQLDATANDLGRAMWRALAIQDAETVSSSIRQIEAMEAMVATEIEAMRVAVRGSPMAADFAAVETNFPKIRASALHLLQELQAGRREEAMRLVATEILAPFAALRTTSHRLTEALLATAAVRSEALTRDTGTSIQQAIITLGLGVVLSLAFGIWLTLASVVRPFARLDRSMQALAAGDLSTGIADTDRGDEIGAMARALQGFGNRLREAEALRQNQETLKHQAETDRKAALVGLADTLEERVGGVVDGIAAAASELNAAATSMVGIADATSGRATTVSNATADASANVNTVAAATEELAASVAEISRQIAESARMANGAVEQANRTNTTVANLTEAASRIGEVTRLIGDIAGQTNLLALNATIEAARAGEAGKGFAVVASEVKALANQTAQATGNIASQIQAMQAATREAATDIGAIRDSIDQINTVTAAIAAAVEEQGAATRDIAQNVQRAAAGTNEIAGAIEGVTAAAAETGGAANQVQSTSGTLAEQAETLKREMSGFLGRVRAA